ncbi:outer membrane protein TolC [Wenyingzhuangia heitensis]|uniref:Outer membrane protein TolC n=1 Tax=Wenyingzhuangia heitensis TaxID=1487859 RepID=A0ABX0UC48_9FLAO|nr:TolC family protein [Wenyingzhuangia heitensis]NIJ46407.1 outer membrane protein TolC [Wenyingzhuangia heitensis]
MNSITYYSKLYLKRMLFLIFLSFTWSKAQSQTLNLKNAIASGMENYGSIKAKENYSKAATEEIARAKRTYLPNFNLAAQQVYGTVNGQNGPMYGSGGLGVASSGLPLEEQNWNAAFGSLYLANVNWDFFTFGKIRQQIQVAKATSVQSAKDLEQEKFKQKIKITTYYLNLLASQRMLVSQQKNLDRVIVIQQNAASRVKNGLLPAVDSILASAEVSKAKIALNQIKQQVKTQNNQLASSIGIVAREFVLDTHLVSKTPQSLTFFEEETVSENPILSFYNSKIEVGTSLLELNKKELYPNFSLFGVFQTRGSGFSSNYATNQNAYTTNYLDGIDPVRHNYLMGVGLSWNLTEVFRISKKITTQKFINTGLEEEYKMIDNELNNQLNESNTRLQYALENYKEAPLQVQAAQKAYEQRMALYKNGLTNLVDVTQALYILNRAEVDQDVINTNVWQALLMKAAATGDFNLFFNQYKQ